MSETIENLLQSPRAETTVGELFLRATRLNAERINYTFTDKDDRPVAAFIVIVGENTQDFLTALSDEEERLECAGEPNDE